MSKLDEMIKTLCPDGVEYRMLTDVANVLYGYPCNASKFNDSEGNQIIRIRDVLPGKTETYSTEIIPENYIINDGDFLVGMDGNFNTGVWKGGTAYLCQRVCKISTSDRSNVIDGFLVHLLGPIFKQIEESKLGGTVKHLSAKDIKSIEIPVPPLEIQEEIVKTLDKFTNYVTELTAELTARKLQYEHYKDALLRNGEPKKLSDIASYSKDRIEANKLDSSTYVGVESLLQNMEGRIDSERVPLEGNCCKYQEGDILIGNIRPYLKKCWFADNEGGTNGDVLVIRSLQGFVLPKYLYYALANDSFFEYDMQFAKGAKMPRGSKDAIMNYIINVPSVAKQEESVKILDRYEMLCNDILTGLPAEIEARKKQFEYYRDKLLTFERKEA